MVDTALTLITDALLDLGVLADEETPSASQVQGGLRKLNNMVDSWNIENLLVYGANSYVLPLIGGQGVYTIGPGGNLNIPRPAKIQSAYLRDTTQPVNNRQDLPLYIASNQEWQDVNFKGMTATYPYNLVWFNETFPLISAYLNPIPSTSQYSLVLWVSGLISTFSQDDVISLAPGYKRALISNLAIELSPSYGVQVNPVIVDIAQKSKAWLKINNTETLEMDLPSGIAGIGYFDIMTGWSR